MTVVILGATKGIGRAVARAMAARGDRLFLLGRGADDVQRSASDLDIRAGRSVVAGTAVCDLARPETFVPALDAAAAALGKVDTVVVTAAEFGTQVALEADLDRAQQLLTTNFANTVTFCEHARQRLLAQGGTLCVVSSVAGDRGRKPVILYGAAKAGLSHYLEGLDHKFRSAGLRVVCVRPGFVKTGMTAGLKPPPFAGEPESVARDILRGIDRGQPVVYTPRIWQLVMLVIRWLPRSVMRRIEF
ncbi:MAG TPA: SDR family NAD(P)-dependent oxidoreductase [Vicinamibacterales bacterium]|nr:SDR family NAD(P)-dependent oxidoreductase [Vicinamibacterales bacterium]